MGRRGSAREAITSSGGWQHDTLTEDLDCSYRAQMKGWRFMYLPEVGVPGGASLRHHAFKTQQNRWTMGAHPDGEENAAHDLASTAALR